ncbi:hypothetical protein FG386_003707 [Cryptosporidium ryanae]|uniref:uncharacterized protein n=1 Tax=Cryptosporidium ryanae TaxID=515981 RepID=UPI00351A5284|nr:hypothetical protein FG386_003707 [Cryptosporidium ryanae]
MRKISNKASIFLNHKHFHPGNSKNREKLWLAEEKKKEEERKQEELLKKRKKELEIEELKKDFKTSKKDSSEFGSTHTYPRSEIRTRANLAALGNEQIRNILMGRGGLSPFSSSSSSSPFLESLSESNSRVKSASLSSHYSVWGSHFDLKTKKWGYRCCKSTDKNSICTAKVSDYKDTGSIPSERNTDNLSGGSREKPRGSDNGFKGKQYKGVSEFLNILKETQAS